jgi:MoaA/NifB/PqqE/SkfB family radical SAM enzyme
VRLFGQGEVCVLPWVPDYIAHIRKLIPQTQILISTNGSRLASLAECFVEHQVTHLFLSVEGGTKEVHERIRGPGSFDELVGGLEVLQRVKAAAQRERPSFEFTAVLTSETVFDLVNLVELGHRFGARGVKTQALVPHKELNLQRLRLQTLDDLAVERAREHIEEARRRAESYGIEFRHLNAGDPFNEPDPEWNDIQRAPEQPAAPSGPAYRDCFEPWKELWINVAYGLNTCERRRFDAEFGVDKLPLRELLVAPGLQKVRRDLLLGELDPICGGCILRKPSTSPPDVVAWARDRLAKRT